MKVLCLLFAVSFLFATRADVAEQDQKEMLPPEQALEDLLELQDQNEALEGIEDGVPEDPGNISQRGFTQCDRRGHSCYWGLCPRGTVTVGKCSTMYRCCKRK